MDFLSGLQATAKLCIQKILFQTESVGFPTVTTALRTELGTTLVIGVETTTARTAYFRYL
jgi:hypothetical protein